MRKRSVVISFGLDPSRVRKLEQYGKKYDMSVGQYARELIIRVLDSDREDLLDALNLLAGKMDETHTDVKTLRDDLRHDLKKIAGFLQAISGEE